MRVCVFGAGAVGGNIAARLARGGADVSLVARGGHLAAIRERGLTLHARDGEHHSHPRASDDPRMLGGAQDAVIVTVKAPQQTAVAAAIAPLLGPETLVVFVQNGIPWWYFDRHGGPLDGTRLPELDPGEAIRRAVGVQRVIGGVVYAASSITAPGAVELEAPTSKLVLGAPDGGVSPRLAALAAAIEAGGMACQPSGDIRSDILSKLISNIANGPLCLLTRNHSRGTLGDPAIRAAAIRMGEEAEGLVRALGRAVRVPATERIATIGAVAHKPSILQDLEAGRGPLEIDAMFTVPLRLARMLGVPTPTLDLAVALAVQAAQAAGVYPVPAEQAAPAAG